MTPQHARAPSSLPVALDPLAFPLHGSRLIEASAGTGKTFTIATLYLRLVLGHGGEAAFARPLTPPEILVVTFTDAATQELRERIRARLVQAAAFFEARSAAPTDPGTPDDPDAPDEGGAAPPDALLESLLQDYAPGQWPSCARQLRLAAEWMDEAAVSTIHGWCYRMLREHAFDSGSLFQQELIADERELLGQAVRDYWRRHFYPLSADAAAQVLQCFKDPDALAAALRPLLGRTDAAYTAQGQALQAPPSFDALLGGCEQWAREQRALELRARELWLAHAGQLRAILVALRPDLNATTFAEKKTDERFEAWLDALALWARTGEGAEALKLKRLAQGQIRLKGKKEATGHAAFEALAALAENESRRPELAPGLTLHALDEVRRALAQAKRQRAELGFDDLLARLDQALAAAQGESLATAIRQRFAVALIDEFQDTDPLQYRIFERIYGAPQAGPAADGPEAATGLFMIGDPKQAIYAFRGADIHTYLQARAATAGRHYTLGTNYRSSAGMVDAVNHCFGYAEARHARGAFRFARPGGGNPVPFLPVRAHGRPERLEIAGRPAPALTAWLLRKPGDEEQGLVGATLYRAEMAERTASAIRQWLAEARQGATGLRHPDGRLQPLRPADIAILVRGRTEAEAVRQALARRQLASVYLSDRDSVFDTPEAADLLWWLQACAEPSHDGRLRTALATATMGLPWAELDRLNQDEAHWERMVQRIQGYRRAWAAQGVLPMLRRWLADFDVAARLLAQPQGERRLTNVLHLAEWLQRQSLELDGEHALIRALAEQLAHPTEEEILRLESDAGLIKVITIHKSKGLEYPLVLLPFIAGWKEVDARSALVAFHRPGPGGAPGYIIELAPGKGVGGGQAEALAQANDERLSEDMRLLYVALTRARHAVWLGVAPLASGTARSCELHKGALGYMLGGGGAIEAQALPAMLADWRRGCEDIAVEPAPQATADLLPAQQGAAPGPARAPRGAPALRWWIASYSALRTRAAAEAREAGEAGEAAHDPASAQEALMQEEAAQQAATLWDSQGQRQEPSQDALAEGGGAPPPSWREAGAGPAAAPRPGSLHALPKGAEAGSFIHGLLELAARQGFAQVAAAPQAWQAQIARQCALRGWAAWSGVLQHSLPGLLAARLPLARPDGEPGSLALAELQAYASEMEFWFAASAVDTRALDRQVGRLTLGGLPRAPLLPDTLNGMLKGYMDLVFEHQGRYFIADYKSNWLGPDDGAYGPAALREAMLAHRYDLQYALYLLALHRLLASRLPGYDYDRDVGGVLYLFIRGLGADGRGVFFDKPPRALIEALDALFAHPPHGHSLPVREDAA